MSDQKQTRLSLGERVELALSVFIHAFIRLLLILAVILVAGLAIYYGFPYLYQQFILPVQTNTTHLKEIQAQEATDVSGVNQRLDSLQARLAVLEQQATQDKETLSDLQSRLNTAESLLASHTATLKELTQIQSQISQLNQSLAQNQADTASLGNELHASNSPLAALSWEVQTLKATELVSRARLYLIQNNAGYARQDVEAARQLLTDPTFTVPADQQAALVAVLTRLNLVLGNLPSSPVTAADDLEIAWRQLAVGLSNNPNALFNPGAAGLAGATTTYLTPAPTGTALSAETGTPGPSTLNTTPTRTVTPTGTPSPTLTPTETP